MDGVVHVTDEQRQREEIERDEQWFAGLCERSVEINTSRIKRTVQIAVEEQWLAGHVPHDVPAGLADRTRQAVREALIEAPSGAGDQGRNRVMRVWSWVGGGLAVAATIGLAVIGSRNLTPTVEFDDATMNYATAFEEFQDDDALDQEISKLRDAFMEMDQTVSKGWGEDLWEEPADEASVQTDDGV